LKTREAEQEQTIKDADALLKQLEENIISLKTALKEKS
jgi:dynactin complex subunit